jgi:hypothetical protein
MAMSAEVPTPAPDARRSRPPFLNSNRRQVILFAVLTLLLTVATVWGGRIWLGNSETLTFAVGESNGFEARFAAKLAAMLKSSSSRFQLKLIPNADNGKTLAQFDRKLADLAVLRTDIGERIAHAQMEALEGLQDELESVLCGAVIGLRDGTVSSDGLDTFKLSYEFARDEIDKRRESLNRQGGHDGNVVVVKTAQSA